MRVHVSTRVLHQAQSARAMRRAMRARRCIRGDARSPLYSRRLRVAPTDLIITRFSPCTLQRLSDIAGLRESLSLEVVPSQDVVHAPRPDQFLLRVGHEEVAPTALVQAGVDES